MRTLRLATRIFASICFLAVLGMSLLVLAGVGHTQTGSGKDGPMAKVSGDLSVLYAEYVSYLEQGRVKTFKPSNPLLRVIADRVVIDAVASGDAGALQSDLEALGMQKAAAFGRIVSGQLSIGAIDDMAALDSLKFARPVYAATRRGSSTFGAQQAPNRGLPQKGGVAR